MPRCHQEALQASPKPGHGVSCCTHNGLDTNSTYTYWEMPSTFMSLVVHEIVASGSPTNWRREDLVGEEGIAKRFLDTLEIRLVATGEL